MDASEITYLDELRIALRSIEAQFQVAHIALNMVRTRVENAYYAACVAVMSPQKQIPRSMKSRVPDAAYAWGCGDDFAQMQKF